MVLKKIDVAHTCVKALHVFPFLSAPKYIKMFALDEADEMLSRGFKDQIYEIFQKLSADIQVKMCGHSEYNLEKYIFSQCVLHIGVCIIGQRSLSP